MHDLQVAREPLDQVLVAYDRVVVDPARRRRAQTTLNDAVQGHLQSENDLVRLVEVLYFSGRQPLLAKHHLLFPAYRINEEYFLNAAVPCGPLVPRRPRVDNRSWMVLGKRIGFPIGVPASVLTANAQWIHYFSRNGFNVLTYKTVRSRAHEPSPPPNWVFLPRVVEPLPLGPDIHEVVAEQSDWVDVGRTDVSTANSFGVPSSDPEYWEPDLEESLNVLHDDQILIVSVMGDDYDRTARPAALADDFAFVAKRAERAGAEFIELNLSCPNSLVPGHGVKPPMCLDVDLTREVVEAVRARADPGTRIIAKLSYLPMEQLERLVTAIGPLVDAFSGINTLQSQVTDGRGQATFPGRLLAGISGIAIRNYALDFVTNLARLRLETGLRYEIIGMGGVTDVDSFTALYDAGAVAVQSANGVFANPFLAWECVASIGWTLPLSPPLTDESLREEAKGLIVALVSAYESLGPYTVANGMPIPPSQTLDLLTELVRAGRLRVEETGSGFRYRHSGSP